MNRPLANIGGYAVYTLGVPSCVEEVTDRVMGAEGQDTLSCLNPHSLALSRRDESFANALRASDWLLPDGVGIVMASRLLGGGIGSRITGMDIFLGVMEKLSREGGFSVFFLGSTEDNLEKMRTRVAADFPGIKVAGTCSPPYKAEFEKDESMSMVRAVNESQADLLWVGLGAPKQEKWIYQNKDRLNVRFIGAVGAVFDFYAGNVKRAPVLVRKMGLEWLYRWAREPKRLWKRNVVSMPRFVLAVLKQKFGPH